MFTASFVHQFLQFLGNWFRCLCYLVLSQRERVYIWGGEGILMSRCSVACVHRNPTVVSAECRWREGSLEFTGRRAFFFIIFLLKKRMPTNTAAECLVEKRSVAQQAIPSNETTEHVEPSPPPGCWMYGCVFRFGLGPEKRAQRTPAHRDRGPFFRSASLMVGEYSTLVGFIKFGFTSPCVPSPHLAVLITRRTPLHSAQVR